MENRSSRHIRHHASTRSPRKIVPALVWRLSKPWSVSFWLKALLLPTGSPFCSHHIFHEPKSLEDAVSAAGSVHAFIEPVFHHILRGQVFVCGLGDAFWCGESSLLPLGASLDHPFEDADTLPSAFRSDRVAVFLRDCVSERDKVEAATNRLVHRVEARLVISRYDQFEARLKLEKILGHEASRNHTTAGEGFDLGFRPSLALLSLRGGYKTPSDKPR